MGLFCKPSFVLALAALLGGSSCGYTHRITTPDGRDLPIFVPLVRDPGLDVDAAGLVDGHLRREVARTAGLRLSSDSQSNLRLEVEVVDVRTALAPFAEPGLRAAQYRAVVIVKGRLVDSERGLRWSGTATGEAPYLSTGGPIEALDGAGRRALGEAAELATRQLVDALVLRLRSGTP